MSEAYIVDGVRSAIGKFGGTLAPVRPDDLAAAVIKQLIERNSSIDTSKIDDVILGCANQAGEDNRNIARMASLLSGLPTSIPGETVNRLCASGLSSITWAARSIRSGEGDLFIAGGVESMTRAPFVLSKSETAFSRNSKLYDTSIGWRFVNPRLEELYGVDSMGQTAENVARKFNISRKDQDEFACHSQIKAAKAREAGRFKTEIVPIEIPQRKAAPVVFDQDEFIRPDSTVEILSKLKPAFASDDEATVTAGNSSGINDGSAALLIASDSAVKDYSLKPIARIVASTAVGVEPCIMGIGPVEATKKVLELAKLKLEQMSVIELNEAFAAQSLACIRELGLQDDDSRINPNGGAIALGHPLGMSGSRLMITAARELEKRGEQYALCTMCVGVGQGMAAIIERT